MAAFDVLGACEDVAATAELVRLDREAVERLAERLAVEPRPEGAAAWPPPHLGVADAGPERVAGWTLQLSGMNFSFWQDEPRWRVAGNDGYMALATALRRAHDRGVPVGDATADAARGVADLAAILQGDAGGPAAPPLLAERHAVATTCARRLLADHGGSALAALGAVADAAAFASYLATTQPLFRDVAEYRGRRVPILKRAQIAAYDCGLALGEHAPDVLRRRDGLTAFADYKLPQLLREEGLLVYAPALAATVDAGDELRPGCEAETEIRALTVVAVERLRHGLRRRGVVLPACDVDSLLWWRAQGRAMAHPAHRVRTIWY